MADTVIVNREYSEVIVNTEGGDSVDIIVNPIEVSTVIVEMRQGDPGPPGSAGGLDNVVEDLTPELGGDLMLNGFQIRGTVNNSDFTLDCGLI